MLEILSKAYAYLGKLVNDFIGPIGLFVKTQGNSEDCFGSLANDALLIDLPK